MGLLKWLLKTRLAKRWIYSGRNCLALKTDGATACDQKALKGSRYCLTHQSSIPLVFSLLLPLLGWFGNRVWSFYHPTEELTQLRKLVEANKPSLSVIDARVDIGRNSTPLVSGKWKNFGVLPAQEVRLDVLVTDAEISKVLSLFTESIHDIGPGADEGFWGDLKNVKPPLPWPEMIVVLQAQYHSPGIATVETNLWLGILKDNPAQSLTTIPAGFAPVNAEDRAAYLPRIGKLLNAQRQLGGRSAP